MDEINPQPAPEEPSGVPLNEVLVALQKSFSRVSQSSFAFAQANEGSTVALMVGNIEFEIEMHADVRGDRIVYNRHGAMKLKFKGEIDPDHKEEPTIENT